MSEQLKGHGHVTPNADGLLARCGGPSICKVCKAELAALQAQQALNPVATIELTQEGGCKLIDFDGLPAAFRLAPGVHYLYAAPVSEAKAQGVVMPERWNVPRPMWKDARQPYGNPLNHADIEAAEKFNLALDEVARLNAAPVQRPKCKTCDDNGRIGGPSFYAPDEGGYPCPDCCAPVQQVSVPDDEAVMAKARELFGWAYGLGGFSDAVRDLVAFAHPAAPAADAWISVSERLPGEDDQVLCWCEDETVAWAEVSSHHNSFFTDMTHELLPVTHWMPLPAAPIKIEASRHDQ